MTRDVDPRPITLALAAWSGAWAATGGQTWLWLVAAAVAALALVGASVARSASVAAVGLLLAAALGGGVARSAMLQADPVMDLARKGAIVEVEVVLRGAAKEFAPRPTRPAFWTSDATVANLSGRGEAWRSGAPVEVDVSGDEVPLWRSFTPGSTVRVVGKLSPPDPDAGLAAVVRARGAPQLVAPPGAWDAGLAAVREGLRQACRILPTDARALVPALVVGDTSALSAESQARFKVTGLTHLCAVSGANLVLLLAFVKAAAIRLGVRGRRLTAVLGATVFAFVALCLGEPSVVRAAAMGLVGLAALGSTNGGRQGIRYLAVAVVGLVLWDPWISRSLGFALSVTASAGLLWWAGPWTAAMGRWAPAWLAESVSVPLAAQLATQPIVTAISGQVSLVGLLANAVSAPLVGPATVAGFVAAGASVVWLPLAWPFAWLAGACAQGLDWIARIGASLPGAATSWPASPTGVLVMALACLLLALLAPVLLSRRWVAVLVTFGMVLGLSRTPTPAGWPPTSWAMVSCDVGQGDATLIRAGPDEAILVDAGPDPALLRRCLDQLGVGRVPLAFLTHLHADHVSGLPVLPTRGLQVVVTSAVRSPASGEALVDAAVAAGASHVTAEAGSAWTVGDARVEVLSAPPLMAAGTAEEGESSAENDASLLLRVSVRGFSVLLAGDTENTGQERLLDLGTRVDSDVLLVPHHGSSRQSEAFLALSTPELALISVGAKNDYGHPTAKTLQLVGRLTPNVLRTDQHGSIAVDRLDGAWKVTTQR